ncbi:tetratricopeptide repeat protein [Roseovarius nitratireducens]|uniref:tetratricopeptide repeat protein n=1 Tax=Roseovarius nitratireducens TaxID=2044597 RepID=UPI000CE27487|nr:tetratricopeptide repeat protein [Roseovarius nitratireducens]
MAEPGGGLVAVLLFTWAITTHLNNLAGVLVKLNRAAETRPLLERALAIFRATLPTNHPQFGVVERDLAALPDD